MKIFKIKFIRKIDFYGSFGSLLRNYCHSRRYVLLNTFKIVIAIQNELFQNITSHYINPSHAHFTIGWRRLAHAFQKLPFIQPRVNISLQQPQAATCTCSSTIVNLGGNLPVFLGCYFCEWFYVYQPLIVDNDGVMIAILIHKQIIYPSVKSNPGFVTLWNAP